MRQTLQDIFEQAEWKQPSVVLLDDLDHLSGAPTSPEHEHGAEALLQQHIAQSKSFILNVYLCGRGAYGHVFSQVGLVIIPGLADSLSSVCGCRSDGCCG